VVTSEIGTLAPEVRAFDPCLALDGGADGLDAYRAIAADAARLLAPGGHLVVEVGAGQADTVARLFAQRGLGATAVRCDLAGVARAVTSRATHDRQA
jgi:release factor glutamine methyltransferase